jgi:hypothetical protein
MPPLPMMSSVIRSVAPSVELRTPLFVFGPGGLKINVSSAADLFASITPKLTIGPNTTPEPSIL